MVLPLFRQRGRGEIGVEKETKGPLGSSRGGKKPLQGGRRQGKGKRKRLCERMAWQQLVLMRWGNRFLDEVEVRRGSDMAPLFCPF